MGVLTTVAKHAYNMDRKYSTHYVSNMSNVLKNTVIVFGKNLNKKMERRLHNGFHEPTEICRLHTSNCSNTILPCICNVYFAHAILVAMLLVIFHLI